MPWVEVACALALRQMVVGLEVGPGTTPQEAVRRSGILLHFPELDPSELLLCIHSRAPAADYRLRDGDRVELCRPLPADPRQLRRARLQALRRRRG